MFGSSRLLAIQVVLAASAFAQAGQLALRTGTVETSAANDLRQADATAQSFDASAHYVVQLDGPITPERRAQLLRAGVQLGDYLPQNAYIVALRGVAPADLRALEFVAWVGEYRAAWKRDPDIGARSFATAERQQMALNQQALLDVTLFDDADSDAVLAALAAIPGVLIHGLDTLAGDTLITLTAPLARVDEIASLPQVQFVEPTPEVTFRNATTRWIIQSNQTNVTPLYDNGIHGEGQVVGVMDGKLDVNHCSFDDTNPIGPTHRKILAYNTSLGASSHGTHVSGTACGDNFADDNTRGMAYLAKIVFDDIPSFTETAMYNNLAQHHGQGARVHTNSWGDDGTTSYNSLCRGIDSFSYDNEESLVFFAVTNTSTLKNPENAKNLLAVGATSDTPSQASHCTGGAGPTSDGRRKPEIYAPGCNTTSSAASTGCSVTNLSGTSMASPAVTGLAALVRQYYEDGYYPLGFPDGASAFVPSGALVKATLLNACVDMTGVSGYPSNQEGWGRLLADNALHFDGEQRTTIAVDVFNNEGLSTNDVVDQLVQVTGSAFLRATLVWTDPPASAGAGQAFINNLDLELISPGGTTYRGNVFSGGVSTTGGAADTVNNVEQTHIVNPEIGQWTARVRATAVNVGAQGYALVVTGEVTPELPPLTVRVVNPIPTLIDPGTPFSFNVDIRPGTENVLAGSPTLHYRFDGGAFQQSPLAPVGGDIYEATLPAPACGDDPEFYVSAEGDGGTTVTDPSAAPATVLATNVGTLTTVLADNFEQDLGWTVTNISLTDGAWERAIPHGTADRGDPPADADGSGFCYVTDNALGNSDVDGGPTRLTTPLLDMSGGGAHFVSYARWFTNDDGDDRLDVEISNDDGASWTLIESVPGASGWTTRSLTVTDYVATTAQVRMRFSVADNPNGSITEAGLDAFEVTAVACDAVPCPGDLDGSGAVDITDVSILLANFGTTSGANPEDGDLDGDGDVDLTDLSTLLALFGVICA